MCGKGLATSPTETDEVYQRVIKDFKKMEVKFHHYTFHNDKKLRKLGTTNSSALPHEKAGRTNKEGANIPFPIICFP